MCVNPAVESMELVLTSGEKGRFNEPFAFGQNNALSNSCVCSMRALCPQPRVSHFCTCVTKGHRETWAWGVRQERWLPQPIGSQVHMTTGWTQASAPSHHEVLASGLTRCMKRPFSLCWSVTCRRISFYPWKNQAYKVAHGQTL